MCALPLASPLHQTTRKDQHGAMLLLILYNNQKLTPSQCFWDSPSKMSQRWRQVQPWLPAFKAGNCPPLSCPSLSAHLHYKSSSSKVSVHLSIIISSSMGRSSSCKTGWKRITFFFKDSWPQTEEEAPLPQSPPHISSAASPSPASGQEVGSMVGSFHFTL